MFWQDGRRVTPWDVKFTFLTLQATGAFQGGVLAPVTGVTVLGPEQFDVNVNAVGPFTLSTLTSVTILPGHYWSTCSGSVWDGYVGVNNVPGTCMNADPTRPQPTSTRSAAAYSSDQAPGCARARSERSEQAVLRLGPRILRWVGAMCS